MASTSAATGVRFTDFVGLRRRSSPNNGLIAPEGLTTSPADAAAPVFEALPADVARAWIAVIESQPRTAVLALSSDGLAIEAEQRSAVFGFVDRISARAAQVAPGRSTIAVYSRSLIGWWDLGVNRRRLRDWIAALRLRLPVAAARE